MNNVIKNKILLLNYELVDARLKKDKERIKELSEDIQYYINSYKKIMDGDGKEYKQTSN